MSINELSIDEDVGCLAPNGKQGKQYDPFIGAAAGLGGGGTSTVIVDRNGRVVKDFVSLDGTIRNCAGGPTPWGSWISCEEDVTTPAISRCLRSWARQWTPFPWSPWAG